MSDRRFQTILITGGAGFIGSHVVRHFVKKYPSCKIVNLDKLTYSGNLESLKDLEAEDNYHFVKGCITDEPFIKKVFEDHRPELVLHLAAESHVDRSILDPLEFVRTNVLGTVNLLNVARDAWENKSTGLFYLISTDEVFGSLGPSGFFNEDTPYDPRSPYSASKASADHFARAYHHTYQLPILISNCSNNYGPYQFPEKLIPLMINNVLDAKALPVYGDGKNVRDWLYVQDHVEAIDLLAHRGEMGHTYNIGGWNECTNIDLVEMLCDLMDEKLEKARGTSRSLISFVKDRPGHDRRYAIDSSKIHYAFGWKPTKDLQEGLSLTIDWYLSNLSWLEQVTSGAYQKYYSEMYKAQEL
ncbi:MAG: dTDP-glucose 4,6-dehydratase [Saprospiraceae bacterium]|nr:dTDP-glucose 4,6-dehydratase [Saprospiraceae bacterium]